MKPSNQTIHFRAWKQGHAYSLCMPNALGALTDPAKGRVVGNMQPLGTSTPNRSAVTCTRCAAKLTEAAA